MQGGNTKRAATPKRGSTPSKKATPAKKAATPAKRAPTPKKAATPASAKRSETPERATPASQKGREPPPQASSNLLTEHNVIVFGEGVREMNIRDVAATKDAAAEPVETGPEGASQYTMDKHGWFSSLDKVLSQVHPDTSITNEGKALVDMLLSNMFCELRGMLEDRVAEIGPAETLKAMDNPGALSLPAKDVIQVLLTGELFKHALSEGSKAVTKGGGGGLLKMAEARLPSHSECGLQFDTLSVRNLLLESKVLASVGPSELVWNRSAVFLAAVLECKCFFLSAQTIRIAAVIWLTARATFAFFHRPLCRDS